MRRASILVILAVLAGGAAADETVTRTQRMVRLDLTASLPLELDPAVTGGVWDLSRAPATAGWRRSVEVAPGSVTVRDDRDAAVVWTAPDDAAALTVWLSPHRAPESLVVGARRELSLTRAEGGRERTLEVSLETLGAGRLKLASGMRHVVLQRAWVDSAAGRRMVLRWIEPDAGTLAEVWGTGAPDGSALTAADDTSVRESVQAAADLKIYADQVHNPVNTELILGWDLGSGVPISSVLVNNEGVTTMGDLVNLDYWDFSQSTGGVEVAQTTIPATNEESCNIGLCGFDLNDRLGRQDRDFEAPDPADRVLNTQITEREDRVGDVTIWLRAAALREGVTGCFGAGESRVCYDPADGRPEVALWQFTHQDVDGWYIEAGDAWASAQFQCDQTVFNTICGADPPGICLTPAEMWAQACSDKAGNQVGSVLKGGVVTIPSGHTLNALVTRTVTEFCAYSGSACFIPLQQVRVVVHLWQVPWVGSVTLMQSGTSAPDPTSFTTLDQSNFAFGLYPPLSTAVETTTANSIDISWTPSKDTTRIDDYKIYWDTDSGAVSGYTFNSVDNAGQVTFNGNSATISGLTGGTTYYFAVVARYGHPRVCVGGNDGQRCVLDGECGGGTCSGSETVYESILFPKQIEGDPGFVYPVEVQATTIGGACAPTEEVANVTVERVNGGIRICWDPVADACLGAYDVSGAVTPEVLGNFNQLAQTGRTCWAGDPSESYFLVRTRGSGGTGPLGHYGQ